MRLSFPLLLGTLLLFPGSVRAQFSLPPTGFEAGQPFPHLVLPALEDGQPTSLARFRGKKIILHIFASW